MMPSRKDTVWWTTMPPWNAQQGVRHRAMILPIRGAGGCNNLGLIPGSKVVGLAVKEQNRHQRRRLGPGAQECNSEVVLRRCKWSALSEYDKTKTESAARTRYALVASEICGGERTPVNQGTFWHLC